MSLLGMSQGILGISKKILALEGGRRLKEPSKLRLMLFFGLFVFF